MRFDPLPALLALAVAATPIAAVPIAAQQPLVAAPDTSLRARARNAVTANGLGVLAGIVSAEYIRKVGPSLAIGVSGTYARDGILTLESEGCILFPCRYLGDRAALVDVKLRRYPAGLAVRGSSVAVHAGMLAARNHDRAPADTSSRGWRATPTLAVSFEHTIGGPGAREVGAFGVGLKKSLGGAGLRGTILLLNASYGLVF